MPFPQSERLVSLSDILQGANVGGNGEDGVTAPEIRTYIRDTRSFESLGGYQSTGYELSGIGEPAQVNATRMTGGAVCDRARYRSLLDSRRPGGVDQPYGGTPGGLMEVGSTRRKEIQSSTRAKVGNKLASTASPNILGRNHNDVFPELPHRRSPSPKVAWF